MTSLRSLASFLTPSSTTPPSNPSYSPLLLLNSARFVLPASLLYYSPFNPIYSPSLFLDPLRSQ